MNDSRIARAAVFEGPSQIQMRDIPFPPLSEGDMLVRLEISGVDGSEVHQFKGEFGWLNERAPVILGDEMIGRIVAMGDGANRARGLDVGDRVCIESRWPCEGCFACDRGQYYLCERNTSMQGYGTTSLDAPGVLWGGYATHVFVPATALVYPVPDELSLKAALIACSPLANGVAWTTAGGVTDSSHVAVIGPGPQGLSCALASWVTGAQVTLIGTQSDANRLSIVEGLGIATVTLDREETPADAAARIIANRGPVDVTIEAAGVPAAKTLSQLLVRPMGTIVNASVPAPQIQEIDWMHVLSRQITITSVLAHPYTVPKAFALAIELQSRGVDLAAWVTHTFALDDAVTAVETAGYLTKERPVKTAFLFN